MEIDTEQAACLNAWKDCPWSAQVSDAVLDACLKVDPYSKVHGAVAEDRDKRSCGSRRRGRARQAAVVSATQQGLWFDRRWCTCWVQNNSHGVYLARYSITVAHSGLLARPPCGGGVRNELQGQHGDGVRRDHYEGPSGLRQDRSRDLPGDRVRRLRGRPRVRQHSRCIRCCSNSGGRVLCEARCRSDGWRACLRSRTDVASVRVRVEILPLTASSSHS